VVTISFAGTVDMSCWKISILQQSEATLSISAAFVKTTMTYHSPRATVATGPHGEISQRLRCNPHPPQLGPLTCRNEAPAGGVPGLLRFATRVRRDIANPTYGIKALIIKQPERSAMRPIGLTPFPTAACGKLSAGVTARKHGQSQGLWRWR
jgi:hypothetical protein